MRGVVVGCSSVWLIRTTVWAMVAAAGRLLVRGAGLGPYLMPPDWSLLAVQLLPLAGVAAPLQFQTTV